MTIPILYIGNDWITPNIHPFEKLFFWGTGMKLKIHDDRQKQPQVATRNTTTFQQKKPSHWQEVFSFPSNSSNINLPENQIKRKYKMGPKNYCYSYGVWSPINWPHGWGETGVNFKLILSYHPKKLIGAFWAHLVTWEFYSGSFPHFWELFFQTWSLRRGGSSSKMVEGWTKIMSWEIDGVRKLG